MIGLGWNGTSTDRFVVFSTIVVNRVGMGGELGALGATPVLEFGLCLGVRLARERRVLGAGCTFCLSCLGDWWVVGWFVGRQLLPPLDAKGGPSLRSLQVRSVVFQFDLPVCARVCAVPRIPPASPEARNDTVETTCHALDKGLECVGIVRCLWSQMNVLPAKGIGRGMRRDTYGRLI